MWRSFLILSALVLYCTALGQESPGENPLFYVPFTKGEHQLALEFYTDDIPELAVERFATRHKIPKNSAPYASLLKGVQVKTRLP